MTHSPGKRGFRGLHAVVASAVGSALSTARGVGFWTAILLPVVYVPMVLLGNSWMVDLVNFSKVIGLHVLFLLVGRGHGGDGDAEPRGDDRSAVSTPQEATVRADERPPSPSATERAGEDAPPIPAR